MKIKLDYITINQRKNQFYMTKVNAKDLKEIVDFHFREPYKKYTNYQNKKFEKIKSELMESKVGLSENVNFSGSLGTVQRVLDAKRVVEIKETIINDETVFFPSSILLSIDTSSYTEEYVMEEKGEFIFDSEVMFASVIDGQHRLAGIFLCEDSLLEQIFIPVVFLLDISIATASILFQQINGKQKQVNKSVLYDIFENINDSDITSEDDKETKNYHLICQSFFFDNNSPFYRQIKMLGIGSGTISQAFFIETCKSQLKCIAHLSVQERYDALYDFFKEVQRAFAEYWPVPIETAKYSDVGLDEYADDILKNKRSQLTKTNGFFVLIKTFSYFYVNNIHYNKINELKDKFDFNEVKGTGKSAQKRLYENFEIVLNSHFKNT